MAENTLNKGRESRTWQGFGVCFGTVITFIAGIGHVNSFGLIYNDFMIETKSSAKSLTTAHGVFAIMLAVGGIILNIICKRHTLRFGGLIGAFLFTLGSFATIPITNMNQLSITFGLLQGVGFGMMVPVCYATINHYFKKRRTTVLSIIKAVQGITLMGYPQVHKYNITNYGFRGTLLIISGISLHPIAGMLLMKSATKKKTVELKNKMEEDKFIKNVGEQHKDVNKRTSHWILDIFNINVLRDAVYCNICLGQSFVNFSDLSFFILQPMLLFQYGYSKNEVAFCISISFGADVIGRFTLALISCIISINTRLLFYLATLSTLVIRIAMLQVQQFIWVAAVTSALGFFRAWLHVCSPLVISSHVSHHDFPGAYAMLTLSSGLVNLMFSPIIGLIRDCYQDYVPAFFALSLCCLPCLVLWPIELLVLRTN